MITYDHIAKNKRNSVLLIFVFLILIISLGYVFSYIYNQPEILIFAVGFSVISSLVSFYFSDSITLALSKAREIDRRSSPDLFKLVENLSIAGGLPMPRIYIIDDTAINAFATGRDPEHGVVCVTTGCLTRLNKIELEGVLAHELSHIGNYDIRIMTLVVVLVGIVTLLSDWLLRVHWLGDRKREDKSGVGQYMFLVGLVLAILSPIIASLIKLSVSRQREFLADSTGALLTRYPEGLASALEKIAQDQEPLEAANKATAHLYIANPFKEGFTKGAGWFARLFNTHPPIEERIKRLREMNV